MTDWDKLVHTALLGTEKMQLQENLLPEKVRDSLKTADKKDPEAYFLKAGIMTLTYNKAAQNPAQVIVPDLEEAETETRNFCSDAAMSVLKKIWPDEHPNLMLFCFWLDKCIEKDWVMPEDWLVKTMNLGSQKKSGFLKERINRIIGKRGHWLIQFNSTWAYILPSYEEKIWNDGKAAERHDIFRILREVNPERATTLLDGTWSQESLKDKKEFLNYMQINLGEKDIPVLRSFKASAADQKDLLEMIDQLLQKYTLQQKKTEPGKSAGFWGGVMRKITRSSYADGEREIIENINWQNKEESISLLYEIKDQNWSLDFTRKVLEGMHPPLQGPAHTEAYAAVIPYFLRAMHPDIKTYLVMMTEKTHADYQMRHYVEKLIKPLIHSFEILTEIEKI